MKTVALITWATGENYGTSLQCFAMQKVISSEYICAAVNYEPRFDGVIKKLLRSPFKTARTAFIRRISRLCGTFPLVYEKQEKRHARFLQFRKNFFNLTARYVSCEELTGLNGQFDAFVCGSDQIWNPFGFNSHYFLDFVKNSSKKIAYASSFGTENIESSKNAEKIISLVRDFAFLACREESGAAWLSQKTGKKVPCVLDPTLLLKKDDWQKIANDDYKRPAHYIFCYFLGHNEEYLKTVFTFAKSRGLAVVLIPIYKKDFSRKCIIPNDVGPSEFISLVEQAEFVCTDSFHGCCFSVLFEKPFAPFLRFSNNDKKSQNVRVIDFLEKVGLRNLFFSTENDLEHIFATKINYAAVNAWLEVERQKSLSYLENALSVATGEVDDV